MEKQKLDKIDLDFYENIIIYNVLVDSVYLSTIIDYIKPSLFKNKDIKNVVGYITDFFKKHNQVPNITEVKSYLTTNELKESFKRLVSSFDNLDKSYLKQELYNNTERFIKERSVFNTLLDAAEKLDGKNLDTNKLLSEIENAVNIELSQSLGVEIFKDIDLVIQDINKNEPVINTGWNWLDSKIGGGFLESGRSLYLFLGETNVGKSIFLGNVATNIAMQGKTVLLISLEMSETMYCQRLASNLTKIPMSSLKEEQATLKQQISEIGQNKKDAKIFVKEFPPATVTPNHIIGFVKKFVQKGIKPDAIVIDYINLLKGSPGTDSYERLKDIAEQMRAMSYIIEAPVISASQTNRSGVAIDNPGLETISESLGLAMTADCIFNIWQKDEDKELGLINLGIIKNRFGPNFGSTMLRIDYHSLTLTEENTISETDEVKEFAKSLANLE